jgi:hypothetical protein
VELLADSQFRPLQIQVIRGCQCDVPSCQNRMPHNINYRLVVFADCTKVGIPLNALKTPDICVRRNQVNYGNLVDSFSRNGEEVPVEFNFRNLHHPPQFIEGANSRFVSMVVKSRFNPYQDLQRILSNLLLVAGFFVFIVSQQ